MYGDYDGAERRRIEDKRKQAERERDRLQDQLDQEREDRRRQQERDTDERRDAMRERRTEIEERQLHAKNWEEAFAWGIPRIEHEANGEIAENKLHEDNDDPEWREMFGDNNFFQKWLADVRTAQAIYNDVQVINRKVIDDLEAQIERIKQAALEEVARRIEEQVAGGAELAEMFRRNTPEHLTNW